MHYVYHLYRGCINTRCVCNVFRFLVEQGCIPPLCDLLTVMDSKIVQVALNGLENILRLGEQDSKFNNSVNPYSVMIEECYGGLQQFFLYVVCICCCLCLTQDWFYCMWKVKVLFVCFHVQECSCTLAELAGLGKVFQFRKQA